VRKARALQKELELAQRDYGLQVDVVQGADVGRYIRSPRYCAAAFEQVSGHLHPLKYGLGLAAAARSLGVQIFEHSPVLDLGRGQSLLARTPTGEVRADFAVLAGNCTLADYGPRVAPEIRPRIMPVGTYMVATAPVPATLSDSLISDRAAVCDNNFVLDYFRFSVDHRMLFGGRVSYTTRTPRNLQAAMRQRMASVFPALAGVPVEFVWGGFVDISMNRAPDFGRLGQNIYYLQGFSGHGVALTGLAGRLVAEAIQGQSERLDVFARLRHHRFPGGSMLRTPALALAMAWERLRDAF
jgi:gamma-glutamylputrescine oxidase